MMSTNSTFGIEMKHPYESLCTEDQPYLPDFPDPTYERDMWLMSASLTDLLKEFITKFEQWEEDEELGADLIIEEYKEWLDEWVAWNENGYKPEKELKELADLVYVVAWHCVRKGWDLDEALRRVHESNMSKLGIDGKVVKNDSGKVLKGPNYEPPVLTDLVKKND